MKEIILDSLFAPLQLMNGNPEINAMNDDERRQLEELYRENDA